MSRVLIAKTSPTRHAHLETGDVIDVKHNPAKGGKPPSPDMMRPKPLLELELRPVAAPAQASEGACVYVLLPTLEELVGCPDFGRPDPIWLPGSRQWIDGWTMFGRSRAWTLH